MNKPSRCLVLGLDGAIPSVVARYASEGHLPNLAALIASGVWCEQSLPAFPTITPTCWATLATGAWPISHGVTCHEIHEPGTPLDRPVSGYRSEMTRVERIWEAAERAGHRSLVLQYPTAGPSRLQQGFVVNGTGCSSLEVQTPGTRVTDARYRGVGGQLLSLVAGWRSVPDTSGVSTLVIDVTADQSQALEPLEPFGWRVELTSSDSLRLREWDDAPAGDAEVDQLAEPLDLRPGMWSPVLRRRLKPVGAVDEAAGLAVRYRVKLLEVDYARARARLYLTPLAAVAPNCSPEELAELVDTLPGLPTFDHHHGPFGSGAIDDDTFLEIEQGNFAWLRDAIAAVWARDEVALTFAYAVLVDTINHRYRNILEGTAPASPEALERARRTELAAYRLFDDFLGELLELAGNDTLVVVASDHGSTGHSRTFDPREALKRAGLLQMCPGPDGQGEQIDLAASRAVPIGSVHIFVNLAGREPNGIVPAEEYDRTVEQIVAALYDFTDPVTGTKPVALALPRRDARLLGLGGDRCGDVVFGVTSDVGGWVGGVHACQIPTIASAGGGDIRSMLLLAGAGIRHDVRLDQTVRPVDVVPTICHLLGLPVPADCQGRVLYPALE